jgi:hypothetical protein
MKSIVTSSFYFILIKLIVDVYFSLRAKKVSAKKAAQKMAPKKPASNKLAPNRPAPNKPAPNKPDTICTPVFSTRPDSDAYGRRRQSFLSISFQFPYAYIHD